VPEAPSSSDENWVTPQSLLSQPRSSAAGPPKGGAVNLMKGGNVTVA